MALREDTAWRHFDRNDGLLWDDCNTFLASSDGSIWIGSELGLTRIKPPGPSEPSETPSVTFSEIRLGDQAADPAVALLESRPEPFTARFTVLDLAYARRAQYRYRCVGFDNRWVDTSRPEASYDYLRPGHYRLEVQARWPASPWRGQPAQLELEVLPRWFESPWFEALVLAVACGAIWAVWQARVRHFAAARARLEREVEKRTQELRSANELLRTEIAEREVASKEKLRLEDELLQARKLESIGRLAGGVAHDFNNLLTVINGHCELLLEDIHQSDPVRSALQEVSRAGLRAAEVTRRLLAFSRKQVLQPKPVAPGEIVTGIEAMLRRLARADIELFMEIETDAGLVMADRVQIEQVLINLAANACDAIDGNGRLAISVRSADIPERTPPPDRDLGPGPYVVVTVSDTGHGMSEETLRHLFEPFFTTKTVGKGTGLGLAMVHGVVKQTGGSILVESQPGKGTTFRIYLPRIA